jgi:hypothetical protein
MNARISILAAALLLAAAPAIAKGPQAPKPPKAVLAGVRLGMTEEQVREKLSHTGTAAPEKKGRESEEEGDQQTWAFQRGPYAFVTIGYRDERAFWVTAFLREHGKPVRFSDVGPLATAMPSGNRQWIWNVQAHGDEPAYRVIARGRDSVNVVSISLLHTGPLSQPHGHEEAEKEHGEHAH